MGSCQNHGGVIIMSNHIPKKKNESENIKINKNNSQIDPKFDDMPQWPCNNKKSRFFKNNYFSSFSLLLVECYRGVGIKKMHGYKCNLKIDKLNELREEFWGIRIKQKLIWQTIKQACIMDDGDFHFSFQIIFNTLIHF